ncbi:SDR family NAD(P)-dependent oxidoreductase [Emcibacter nanhaiensis]|uniref:SDR family oxidoreductase n=1 Tax=Emcibacter nanhaiensis TaxID=1505037 RepID=A0A501PG67_9PROT|nr:SDR family NAD(P)-dependent oxidoreductase [Emcibacter nanhaiensis]TPD59479.1 SDR family oxidoreductase [Emcibacter nanhaiensis]
MSQLRDKVCIITGGAGSIGLASAELFAAEGAKVMLVDRNEEALAQAAARFEAANIEADQVMTAMADVGDAAEVKGFIDRTVERWGAIDVLFSNAGNAGVIAPLTDYPEDVFDSVYRVHVRGAFLCCKYGLPAMRDGGSIIITSSVVGLQGEAGPYAYVTAKHAQVGLMRSVAKEAAPRQIRVNTIHPGPTKNDFQDQIESDLSSVIGREAGAFLDEIIPLGRHARPEEIAKSALYLASDQSSFMTGSRLVVDGGLHG